MRVSERQFYQVRDTDHASVGLVQDYLNTEVIEYEHSSLAAKAHVRKAARADDMPLPAPSVREGYYAERHFEYWLSGFSDFSKIKSAYGKGSAKYLDLGGCSGRVSRHAANQKDWDVWCCDINVNYIDWLASNQTRPIRCFANSPEPHLPFADDSFDVVSAFSVFTHIDALEIAWLLELRRIVRPGGLLYLTILDDAYWGAARKNRWLQEALSRGGHEELVESLMNSEERPDRVVLQYSEADAYNVNLIFSSRYVINRWGQFFTSLELLSSHHGPQTVVLLRP